MRECKKAGVQEAGACECKSVKMQERKNAGVQKMWEQRSDVLKQLKQIKLQKISKSIDAKIQRIYTYGHEYNSGCHCPI